MADVAAILEKSTLFSGMDTDEIRQLGAEFEVVTFEPGSYVFREGTKGEDMYILGSGEVAVIKSTPLGDRVMLTFKAGEHFGEMALIGDPERTASLKALTRVECARMGEAGFDVLMEAHPAFAKRILRVVTDRLRNSDEAMMRNVLRAHQAMIFSLAKLAESRDPETGAHLYRVREYCAVLSEVLSEHPKFAATLTDSFIEGIYLVSPLHDIGKVAIPDGILLKEGRLTNTEMQVMSTHTLIGAEALDTVLEYCDFEAFQMARRIILRHHERWDGQGYPHGVKGEDIPVEARIMSVADIYDALLSKRVYKPPMDYAKTRETIAELGGTHLDPIMAEAFADNAEKFEAVHQKYADAAPEW